MRSDIDGESTDNDGWEQLEELIRKDRRAGTKLLFGRVNKRLFGFFYNRAQCQPDDCEDLAQRTWAEFIRKLVQCGEGQVPWRDGPDRFLFGIARNLCLEYIRTRTKYKTFDYPDDLEDVRSGPASRFENLEHREWLGQKLTERIAEEPNEQYRMILSLHFGGLIVGTRVPPGEIAQQARCSVATVNRVIKRFQDAFESDFGHLSD